MCWHCKSSISCDSLMKVILYESWKTKSIKHEKAGTCSEGSFRFTPIIRMVRSKYIRVFKKIVTGFE